MHFLFLFSPLKTRIVQRELSSAVDKVVMLEGERDDLFLIGFIEKVDADGNTDLNFFDGEGRLEEDIRSITYDELTLVSFDSRLVLI